MTAGQFSYACIAEYAESACRHCEEERQRRRSNRIKPAFLTFPPKTRTKTTSQDTTLQPTRHDRGEDEMDSKDSIWIRLFLWLLGKVGCEQPVEEPAGQLPDPAPAKAPRHIGRGGGTRDPFAGYPEYIDVTIGADGSDSDPAVTLEDPDAEAAAQTGAAMSATDALEVIRDRISRLPQGELDERSQRTIAGATAMMEQAETALESGDMEWARTLLRDANAEFASIFAESSGEDEGAPLQGAEMGPEIWDRATRRPREVEETEAEAPVTVHEPEAAHPMGDGADDSLDPVDPDDATAMMATNDRLPTLATLERDALRRDDSGPMQPMVAVVEAMEEEDEDDGPDPEPLPLRDEPEIDAAVAAMREDWDEPFYPDRRVNLLPRRKPWWKRDKPRRAEEPDEAWLRETRERRQRFVAAFAVAMVVFAGWLISIRLPSSPVPTTSMTRVDVGAYATGDDTAARDPDDDGDVEDTAAATAVVAELASPAPAPSPAPTPIVAAPTASTTAPSTTPTLVTVTAAPLQPLGPADRQRLVRRH